MKTAKSYRTIARCSCCDREFSLFYVGAACLCRRGVVTRVQVLETSKVVRARAATVNAWTRPLAG